MDPKTKTVRLTSFAENAVTQEAEKRMREALGLSVDRSAPSQSVERRQDQEISRRRFKQDGEVPFTIRRREHNPEGAGAVSPDRALQASQSHRLGGPLPSEAVARENVERMLAQARVVIHDLQTRLGHIELARNEGILALERERATNADLRRKVELLEQTSEAPKALAGQMPLLDRSRSRDFPDSKANSRKLETGASAATSSVRRRQIPRLQQDQEPVQWWLNIKPSTRKGR